MRNVHSRTWNSSRNREKREKLETPNEDLENGEKIVNHAK